MLLAQCVLAKVSRTCYSRVEVLKLGVSDVAHNFDDITVMYK